MSVIPNVLAERYASAAMKSIWSAEGRIVLEREFWIAVMKAQKELGLDIPAEAIEAYEKVKDQVDVDAINARERITRHDVKARIEEFCDLAGCEHIHKGMTSRDLTENVEQLQVWRAMQVIRDKAVAVLVRLSNLSEQWKDVTLAARTHNVAAQTSTMGKRVAMFGEEIVHGFGAWVSQMDRYAVRGLKGAVGTQLDQLSLFGKNAETVAALEEKVCSHLGIPAKWTNVGQVYPRSLDFAVVSGLVELTAGCASFTKTLRLMAGHELATEGFAKGQTGSSAMPHKMNARSCERVNGFHIILKGYLAMIAGITGDQWNEGDVSCSVVRRCVLPDSFFAADGLLETFLTILDQMGVYAAVVDAELRRYLPFLLTTTILMAAVKRGIGRETAHEVIKEHAVAVSNDLRAGMISQNDLLDRLAGDDRLGIGRSELQSIFDENANDTGMASEQVAVFRGMVSEIVGRFPAGADYVPGAIL
ncbi:adenylosuccinate lyase [Akkermansia glycaniphila]|uniref:adenylosuccinate lyase n=1 Tax=Akkermansia glycaniphila TaxID=1679444 RepID=UPI001C017BB2|nr:adenylosuccinate lyase [Akkermansia glycaniphila]MBT9450607.1 adenylosuccinate lyase [Akkermansia glycaniphila]